MDLNCFRKKLVELSKIAIAFIGLGIILGVIGGTNSLFSPLVDNIMQLIQKLGNAGIVGLLAVIVIYVLYSENK